jgi:hypothetical protein
MTTRTARTFAVAEIIAAYVAEEGDGRWRVRDRRAGKYLDASYHDEPTARAGARLAAAFEIVELLCGGGS